MAMLNALVLGLCASSAIASPRNLLPRNQKRGSSGGGTGSGGPPAYPHDGSWGPQSDDWDDDSWGHTSTSDHPGTPGGYGGGGGWGHSSTCDASTIVETSTTTLIGSASTVYISGSGYTTTLAASTVYISGSDHTSFVPASTVTIRGVPDSTSVSTAYETITQPAVPTTVYLTRTGPGWNHTVTHEETDVVTTTQREWSTIYDEETITTTLREYSTVYDEETTTLTSLVTLPGICPKCIWSATVYRLTLLRYNLYRI